MTKKNKSKIKEARARVKSAEAHSKPGSGDRFKAMKHYAKASGARDPQALAAYIGQKKYGKKGMARMAAKHRH